MRRTVVPVQNQNQNQNHTKEQLDKAVDNLCRQIAELEAGATKQQQGQKAFRPGVAVRSYQTEATCPELAEQYHAILASIGDGYFEIDLAGNLTFYNESFGNLIGQPMD